MDVILLTGMSGIVFQRSLGAYQLADYLRTNNTSCQVIDFINDFTEADLEILIEKFITSNTICVGISTTFLSTAKIDIDNKSKLPLLIPSHVESVCKKIKQKFPNIKICLGGAKSKYGNMYNWVDCVFHGYAEDEFLGFCESLKLNKKNLLVKKLNNQEIYDKPNYKFQIENLNHKFKPQDCITINETLPIEISRGCIFKCKFCAYPLNGKKKFDYIRDPKLIKEELIYNFNNFQTTNYFFTDDTFNDSVYKLECLYNEIIQLPFKIQFTCYLRLDLLYHHPEMINLLRDMGMVSAFFGIESFCQDSLKCIGKNLNVDKMKTFLDDLYNNHWNQKISFNLGFIVGLPFESKENILNTVNWLATRPYSFHFEPLRLSDAGGHYKSEFEKNNSKFGYKFSGDNNWYNDYLTESEAELIATKINTEYAYGKNKPAAWSLLSFLNHFDYEYLKNVTVKEIKYRDILKTRRLRISEYKKLLEQVV